MKGTSPVASDKLIILGGASKRVFKEIPVTEGDLIRELMAFLRVNKVPIASSCLGEGFCRRCIVCENVLSCQITVGEFMEKFPDHTVRVTYL